jgi:hypothetical protein
MTMTLLRFLLLAAILTFASAGTRPEDAKWLTAKSAEAGVVATGTGLLYKGEFVHIMKVFVSVTFYSFPFNMG